MKTETLEDVDCRIPLSPPRRQIPAYHNGYQNNSQLPSLPLNENVITAQLHTPTPAMISHASSTALRRNNSTHPNSNYL